MEYTIQLNVMKFSEKIKEILVNLAVVDKLPLDLTMLDSNVFDEVVEPLVKRLAVLHTDANMALNDDWDRSDDGFEDQITMIEEILDIPEIEDED